MSYKAKGELEKLIINEEDLTLYLQSESCQSYLNFLNQIKRIGQKSQ